MRYKLPARCRCGYQFTNVDGLTLGGGRMLGEGEIFFDAHGFYESSEVTLRPTSACCPECGQPVPIREVPEP